MQLCILQISSWSGITKAVLSLKKESSWVLSESCLQFPSRCSPCSCAHLSVQGVVGAVHRGVQGRTDLLQVPGDQRVTSAPRGCTLRAVSKSFLAQLTSSLLFSSREMMEMRWKQFIRVIIDDLDWCLGVYHWMNLDHAEPCCSSLAVSVIFNSVRRKHVGMEFCDRERTRLVQRVSRCGDLCFAVCHKTRRKRRHP